MFAGADGALRTVGDDGSGSSRIPVELHGRAEQPRWSPDGESIVFGLEAHGETDIYTVNRDGSDLRQVTDTRAVDEWGPDWNLSSPDA